MPLYTNKRLSGFIHSAFYYHNIKFLRPLQHALAPCINQPHNEDQDENNSFDHSKETQLSKPYRPWEQEHGFDIEDQKNERKDIILGFELHPGISNSLYATFIGCLLNGVRLLRSQNPCDANRADRDYQADNKE